MYIRKFPDRPHRRGWTLSEQTRLKQSEMAKRRPYRPISADHLIKLLAGRKAKGVSAETKLKMSVAAVGRTYSQETRAKMSASAKAYIARVGHHTMTLAIGALGRKAQAVSDDFKQLKQVMRTNMHRVGACDGHTPTTAAVIASRLGYTAEELSRHLEALFTDGMSWANYGRAGWNIDHVRPIAHFVRAGITDPSIVNALSNLQPMWQKDNHRKRANYVTA